MKKFLLFLICVCGTVSFAFGEEESFSSKDSKPKEEQKEDKAVDSSSEEELVGFEDEFEDEDGDIEFIE